MVSLARMFEGWVSCLQHRLLWIGRRMKMTNGRAEDDAQRERRAMEVEYTNVAADRSFVRQ